MECHQAAIFFEASHVTGQEQLQRVDALVEQASTPLRPDGSPGLLVAEREEISSIHLEVWLASYIFPLFYISNLVLLGHFVEEIVS